MGSTGDYYRTELSANKLKKCYDLAPRRIQQYLNAEINYVLKKIHSRDCVLELGCGYGRILPFLCKKAGTVIGIDTSYPSLQLANKYIKNIQNCNLLQMDAVNLAFSDQTFDAVVCIQNGISAFHVNQKKLIQESMRIAKPGGVILFSSYSKKFWNQRLSWFQLQSEAGLIGEIDYKKTRNGNIVCKDLFTATTISPEQFQQLTKEFNVQIKITEVDKSSLFCEITP